MLRRRSGLGLLLLIALLATLGTATFGLPDAAFTPSYFDAQDGDGVLWAVLDFARRLSPGSASPAARTINHRSRVQARRRHGA